MKRLISNSDSIFGMANLTSNKSGLPVAIWSDHSGILRKVSHHNTPRVKIGFPGGHSISVTISKNPHIVAKSPKITAKELQDCNLGVEYVARNYDIFLKHYMDTTDSFDDEDLFNALRARGEYK